MKQKIIKIPFANLRKNDFPEIIEAVLEIVFKHNPEALFLQVMYSKLATYKPSLALFITKLRVKDPLTSLTNERYKRAKELLMATSLQIQSLKRSNFSDEQQALATVQAKLGSILMQKRYISKYGVRQVLDRLNLLFSNDEFMTAAETVGIKKYLNELATVNKEIGSYETKKVESRVRKKMADLPALRVEIIESYLNLIKAIELAQVEHSDISYAPLVAEINGFLQPYMVEMKRMKTRKTNNQTDKTTTAALSAKTSATAI